jgi:hypothetical protein
MSKQAVPVDNSTGGKTGVRARVKRKGSNIGRKGRKKIIFRKKVLRMLLGKELAETVSQTLSTTENVAPPAAASAQPSDVVSSTAAPTSAVPKTPLPTPALPLGVIPLAPAQLDGADATVGPEQPYMAGDLDAEETPLIPALDGLHEGIKAEYAAKEIRLRRKQDRHRKKEERRNDKYEQAKTNLEALTSTPCLKCGGQRAYILNFA